MIDSHCHLDFDKIAHNLDNIITNAKKNNITSILSINTDPLNFKKHLDLIDKYKGVYLSYGLHPCNVNSIKQLETLDFDYASLNEKVVGIGETGIDLFYSKDLLKEQIRSFEYHIEASIRLNLPLIIHQRNSEQEIINILNNYLNNKLKIVFHCFTGSNVLRDFCIKNNFYISLSGIVTFKNASSLRNIIKDYPLEFILIETDSPFLAPTPMRGKLNEPSYVKYTADYLSKFYEISLDKFIKITDNNFFKLFNKTKRDNQL